MHLWHTSIFCYFHVFVAKIKFNFNHFKRAVIFQVCYKNFDAGCFWTCFTVKSSDTRGVSIFKHSKISSNVYKKRETNKRRNKQTKNHKHPSGPLIWRYGTRTMFKGLFSTGSTLIQVWQNAFDKEKKYSSYSKYLCEATLLSLHYWQNKNKLIKTLKA